MLTILRKLAVLVLLLALPLQGVAASLSHMLCAPAPIEHAGVAHDHGGGADHSHDGARGDTGSAGHLGCHHVMSGMPSMNVEMTGTYSLAFDPPGVNAGVVFFPEQPQHVPLA